MRRKKNPSGLQLLFTETDSTRSQYVWRRRFVNWRYNRMDLLSVNHKEDCLMGFLRIGLGFWPAANFATKAFCIICNIKLASDSLRTRTFRMTNIANIYRLVSLARAGVCLLLNGLLLLLFSFFLPHPWVWQILTLRMPRYHRPEELSHTRGAGQKGS